MDWKKGAIIYVVLCLAVFVAGIIKLHSYTASVQAVGSLVATCENVFKGQCSRPGQCSWNVTHGSKDCTISCETKISINDEDQIIPSEAKCGTWTTTNPGDTGSGTGGGTAGNGGDDDGWQHDQPVDASGNPMFSGMEEGATESTETKKK